MNEKPTVAVSVHGNELAARSGPENGHFKALAYEVSTVFDFTDARK